MMNCRLVLASTLAGTTKIDQSLSYQSNRFDNDEYLLHEASDMMSNQWPRGGSSQDYLKKILSSHNGLPASYLLVREDDLIESDNSTKVCRTLIGHARLTECFEGLAGSATAATYVIVKDSFRGMAYGSDLMKLLEEESVRLGYHYVYLWTHTAIDFYKKLGYQETERVSLHRACLKPLECEQVSRLEEMLRGKQKKVAASYGDKDASKVANSVEHETVLLPPSDENLVMANDVWLRKRLVEYINSETIVPINERILEIQDGIEALRLRSGKTQRRIWKYHLVEIPWQQQVGPSCGLAVIRMLRDYYLFSNGPKCNHREEHQSALELENETVVRMPSLLHEAKLRGYTDDGEIFDVENLIKLATDFCGLNCNLRSFHKIQPIDVLKMIGPINSSNNTIDEVRPNSYKPRSGLLVLPYDTSKFTRLPCKNSGLSAHYGIIVGLVFAFENISNNDVDVVELGYITNNLPSLDGVTETLVLVQHGLSPKLSIATWNEFVESNQQLDCYDSIKYKVTKLNLKDCLIEFPRLC